MRPPARRPRGRRRAAPVGGGRPARAAAGRQRAAAPRRRGRLRRPGGRVRRRRRGRGPRRPPRPCRLPGGRGPFGDPERVGGGRRRRARGARHGDRLRLLRGPSRCRAPGAGPALRRLRRERGRARAAPGRGVAPKPGARGGAGHARDAGRARPGRGRAGGCPRVAERRARRRGRRRARRARRGHGVPGRQRRRSAGRGRDVDPAPVGGRPAAGRGPTAMPATPGWWPTTSLPSCCACPRAGPPSSPHLPASASAADTLELLDDASRSLALAMEAEALESAQREAAALRRSHAIQRELLSSLSHELRTPLTAIRGYASTLCQPDLTWDAESSERFLRSIASESARLERLVGDLLDSTAIESGSLRLNPDWCDVRLVVEAAANCVHGGDDVRPLLRARPRTGVGRSRPPRAGDRQPARERHHPWTVGLQRRGPRASGLATRRPRRSRCATTVVASFPRWPSASSNRTCAAPARSPVPASGCRSPRASSPPTGAASICTAPVTAPASSSRCRRSRVEVSEWSVVPELSGTPLDGAPHVG